MVKIIAMIKRQDHLTHQEFSRYWRENHGPLAARLIPGLKRYVQNHLILGEGEEPAFDGVAELWLEDMQALQTMFEFYNSDAGKVVRDDEDKFFDRNTMVVLIAEEKVIKG